MKIFIPGDNFDFGCQLNNRDNNEVDEYYLFKLIDIIYGRKPLVAISIYKIGI